MRKSTRQPKRAFTLIELLVVVAIIALLISILLPALNGARMQTKAMKCMANLRSLGQGVLTYAAEERDRLPGDLHPAVYRNMGFDGWSGSTGLPAPPNERFRERQITWMLRKTFTDSGTFKNSVTDRIATCPVLAGIVPDSHFDTFYAQTGKGVYPTHYVINNVGPNAEGSDAVGGFRSTNPPYYFGLSPWAGAGADVWSEAAQNPPRPSSQIERSADEWMIADAWYRPRPNPAAPELQQEGPYQWSWSGEALPHFAPHFAKRRSYSFSDRNSRDAEASQIRSGKQDGKTNTVFFDGHAVPVRSKKLTLNDFELLYGFPGTVNPQKLQPDSESYFWDATWE